MTGGAASALVGAVEVRVGGQALAPAVAGALLEVRVETHVRLPDSCSIRISDPSVEHVDSETFAIGADLEVLLAGPATSGAAAKVFDGQLVALEPEFGAGEVVLALRGYDRSYSLNREPRTQAFQSMSAGDIARRLASSAGLSPGTIDSGAAQDFVQQSNETDWELLWRLADDAGCEVEVEGRRLHFRAAGESSDAPVELKRGTDLVSFRPRVTGVQQVEEIVVRGWDVDTAQALEGTASGLSATSEIGIERDDVVSTVGGGKITVVDRPVTSLDGATALAKSIGARVADAFVEAEGVALGDPRLQAGRKVEIGGVGTRFGGTYALSATTHLFRAGRGYHTRFAISGRTPRSLLALASARRGASGGDWRRSLVVAQVTNNEDPEQLGRVRVKYPLLGADHEGWWARVVAPAAGTDRGILMTPQVNDEVLVAFENGEAARPVVIGSLWNGTAKPSEVAQADGSLVVHSDKRIELRAVDAVKVSSTKENEGAVEVDAAGDLTAKAKGSFEHKADLDGTVEAGKDLTAKAGAKLALSGNEATLDSTTTMKITGTTQLTLDGGPQLKLSGASVKIEATGVLQLSAPQVMLG